MLNKIVANLVLFLYFIFISWKMNYNSVFRGLTRLAVRVREFSSVRILVLGLVVYLRRWLRSRAHVFAEMLSEALNFLNKQRMVFENVTEVKFLKLSIS